MPRKSERGGTDAGSHKSQPAGTQSNGYRPEDFVHDMFADILRRFVVLFLHVGFHQPIMLERNTGCRKTKVVQLPFNMIELYGTVIV
jgi:hypothetical protein